MTAKELLKDIGDNIRECLVMSREIDAMNDEIKPRCNECHCELTDEEIWERRRNGLDLFDEDVVCDECYQKWLTDRMDERKHPDQK